ncbi:uncharacterized protein LOC126750555 [Anthonomus grandis grandis]|uniref:uncharacterized protein LOC126750555 n=1 Tax=Anthonomus grandis grandis TaxID=2921223 RepID=UPI0021668FB9|nr:uncharacterized protein LOC126750555 [Anthonomus grandis grandis]
MSVRLLLKKNMSFKINENHLRVFVEFMEENPDLARGRLSCSNAKEQFKRLWAKLANNLNSLGYGTRTIEKWQRTWSDYKQGLKRRAADIKRERMKTGGGPAYPDMLSDTDQRVILILGKTFFEGCGVEEKGFAHGKYYPEEEPVSGPSSAPSSIVDARFNGSLYNSEYTQPGPSNISMQIPTENKALEEQTNKPRPQKRSISQQLHVVDHDYLVTPRTKRQKVTPTNEIYYQETINLLKSIDSHLETLNEKLGDITEAIRQRHS